MTSLPQRSNAQEPSTASEPQTSRQVLGPFVSMRSIGAALRRRRSVWIGLALAGFVIGLAASVLVPHSYEATTTLYLTHNPADDPANDMANDVAILETQEVAQAVVTKLHLPETAQTFLGQYAGLAISDQVLQVTVSGPSPSSAAERANALDTAYLTTRVGIYTNQNDEITNALGTQLTKVRSLLAALPKSKGAGSTAGTASSNDVNEITSLQQAILSDNEAVTAIVHGSRILDPAAALHSSKKKRIIEYAGAGLVGGLALGCAIVAFGAVAFERVRRRDDIAAALGAPVDIAVAKPSLRRIARTRRLQQWLQNPPPSLRLIVDALRSHVDRAPAPSGLAVVEIDSVEVASVSVAALARALAAEGAPITLLDLSSDRLLSRLLGLRQPGTKTVFANTGHPVTLTWQDEADMVLESNDRLRERMSEAGEAADVVLALVTLDPAIGARHLVSQVSDAVAIVTVGSSKESKLRSVAEMLEEAGIVLRSVVVVGADHDDDTLGHLYVAPPGNPPTLTVAPSSVEREHKWS